MKARRGEAAEKVRRGENATPGLGGMRRYVESYVPIRNEGNLLGEGGGQEVYRSGLNEANENLGRASKPVLSTSSSGETFHPGMLQRREGKEGTCRRCLTLQDRARDTGKI
jgi:hypothetical protein